MRRTLLTMSILGLTMGLLLVPNRELRASGTDPADLWLFPGEAYVDLSDANTTNAWHYPDGSDSGITVNGNAADSKDAGDPVPEMVMTVAAPNPNTTYYVDVVMMNRRGEEDERGFSAGFSSGSGLNAYDGQGDYGLQAVFSNSPYSSSKYLSRTPIGTTASDGSGNLEIHIGEYSGYRGQVDGIIYYESPATPITRCISSVSRSGGHADEEAPIGVYASDTAPWLGDDVGMRLGSRQATDRSYTFDYVDEPLIGVDYVRMFNGDKGVGDSSSTPEVNEETVYTELDYTVTFNQRVFALVFVDDRTQAYDDDDDDETPTIDAQQDCVDLITSDFAAPGTFVDTGSDMSINDSSTDRPFSAFGAYLDAGTYHFGTSGLYLLGSSMYQIGAQAVPEPSGLVLVLTGFVALLRRRRRA